MIPTPETHTFEGMWRPPWETMTGAVPYCPICKLPAPIMLERYNCWLAGHFDTPIYTPKTNLDQIPHTPTQ
jgi:hypothetical protein